MFDLKLGMTSPDFLFGFVITIGWTIILQSFKDTPFAVSRKHVEGSRIHTKNKFFTLLHIRLRASYENFITKELRKVIVTR